jgi:hypothetical protein
VWTRDAPDWTDRSGADAAVPLVLEDGRPMDWVWTAALIWAVLALPVGVLTGQHLRRLNQDTSRSDLHPRRPRRRTSGVVVVSAPVRGTAGARSGSTHPLAGAEGPVPPGHSVARSSDPVTSSSRRPARRRTHRARPPGSGAGH